MSDSARELAERLLADQPASVPRIERGDQGDDDLLTCGSPGSSGGYARFRWPAILAAGPHESPNDFRPS